MRIVAVRFVELSEVAELLGCSIGEAYALVSSGELPAVKVGGPGNWRVNTAALEMFIDRRDAKPAEHHERPRIRRHRVGALRGSGR